MPATNENGTNADAFLPRVEASWRNAACRAFLFSSFLGLAFLLTCSFGCAPAPQVNGGQGETASAPGGVPDITDEMIRQRINGARVRAIPDESGSGEPISWSFHESEPKEITVVDKQVDGTHATIVLDIKTGSSKGARNPRYLAGQIRTEWKLQTGWVLRQWEIVETENISMKYKNLPKPPEQNPNG